MRLIVLSVLLLLAAACAAPPAVVPTPPPPPIRQRVVLVSVDGWRTDLVGEMPKAQALMWSGTWTLRAEAPHPAITVVSHAAMFTGAPPSKNGVDKEEPDDEHLAGWRPLKVSTIFQALEARDVKTGAIFQKRKFDSLVPKGGATVTGFYPSAEEGLVAYSCAVLKEAPQVRFLFIHLADIDYVGHAKGWMSAEQKAAAKKVDGELGELADCVRESQERGGPPTSLIVTADHGGHDKTHGTTADTDRLVPWLLVGHRAQENHEIAGAVRLMDTAPTVARLLGFDPKILLPDAEGVPVGEVFYGP